MTKTTIAAVKSTIWSSVFVWMYCLMIIFYRLLPKVPPEVVFGMPSSVSFVVTGLIPVIFAYFSRQPVIFITMMIWAASAIESPGYAAWVLVLAGAVLPAALIREEVRERLELENYEVKTVITPYNDDDDDDEE
ncbi:hypothetical protein K9M41_03075 [Candidatus Gracilibacteria bacterium]|nr:hypothetical protein [Candidatus Gracilibacteria bacterium]